MALTDPPGPLPPASNAGAQPVLAAPAEVRDLAERLERAGFETWCVGGAVRDSLLGLKHLDWDLATAATPTEVREVFGRVVPVGVEFGTVGVFGRGGTMHEVTTFRRDVRTDGRHAVVEFGASLDEDLARRDFTINAVAYSPTRGVLHDPFDGRGDLLRRVVRAVGVAAQRMREDRLRALRALRFAGRFDFTIDDVTWSAIVASVGELRRLSRERVQQELVKTLSQVDLPSRSLRLWSRSGALPELLPSLAAAPAFALAVADHVRSPDEAAAPQLVERRRLLRLAGLFSHCNPRAAAGALRQLRFSNRDIATVSALVAGVVAVRPGVAAVLGAPPTHSADPILRSWAATTGRVHLADVLRVTFASLQAEQGRWPPDEPASAARRLYGRGVRIAWRDPVEVADLAVDGEDLQREVGLVPGRRIGEVLRHLRDWVLEDPARNERDRLLARARDLGRGG